MRRNIRMSCLIVDTVSSFTAVPIAMDELGIDVLITGSQKALALPPGLALFSASEKAFARAAENKDRGYYFDFLEFQKQPEGNMTPSTPSVGAHPRARNQSWTTSSPKASRTATRAMRRPTRSSTIGSAPRFRVLRGGGLPLRDTDLREQQPEHRRREARAQICASDTTS